MASFVDFVEQTVNTILHSIDEDTREYIASLISTEGSLSGDDKEETCEAVNALIEGADEDNAEELQKKLWAAIEVSSSSQQQQQQQSNEPRERVERAPVQPQKRGRQLRAANPTSLLRSVSPRFIRPAPNPYVQMPDQG